MFGATRIVYVGLALIYTLLFTAILWRPAANQNWGRT